jgi:cytosine deaminase
VLDGAIVGRGHNQRVQKESVVLHAEMDCLENAWVIQGDGRRHLKPAEYRRCVLYSTLSPCSMCSGTVLLYGILRVVVGERRTFQGPEQYLKDHGVEVEVVDDPECVGLMTDFIRARPELWYEDIGKVWTGT